MASVPMREALDEVDEVGGFGDFFSVVVGDDVVGAESGFLGGGVSDDVGEDDAVAFVVEEVAVSLVEVVGFQEAEVSVNGSAFFHDVVEGVFDVVGGDGEADALEAGVFLVGGVDGGVDADDLAEVVDEGAAGVAGVDGGIGLEVVALAIGDGAVACGDVAFGDGFAEAEGVADGDGELADFDFVGVAEFEGGGICGCRGCGGRRCR